VNSPHTIDNGTFCPQFDNAVFMVLCFCSVLFLCDGVAVKRNSPCLKYTDSEKFNL
jgi:hypothetical protein